MEYSIGKAIKNINFNKTLKPFFLKGDDYFLQNFFIKKIQDRVDKDFQIKYINLNEEADLLLLMNNSTMSSLFVEKNIFIIRHFNTVSLKIKNEIIRIVNSQNEDIIYIFILDDYYVSNKFIKELSQNCINVDSRTPFPNKIKEWVLYYLKKKNIVIDNSFLDDLILSYGDDISNIIGEIEKINLFTKNNKIGYENKLLTSYNKRNVRPWQLLDSIGKKDLKKSIKIADDLLLNGFNIIPLVINFTIFFKALIFFHQNIKNPYNGLNKFINNNMNRYASFYKEGELFKILGQLATIDLYSKTTNLKHDEMLIIFITKICNNIYERN